MPPEHDKLCSLLFQAMYFAGRRPSDYGVLGEQFHNLRDAVAAGLRDNDNSRVGLRVLDACERIIYVIDNRGLDPDATLVKIMNACRVAITKPRLGNITEKTWAEQIAGRTRLIELNGGAGQLFLRMREGGSTP